MPDKEANSPIKSVWTEYTKAIQVLLVVQSDDRPLDQYLGFRDSVLSIVQSQQFVEALDRAWSTKPKQQSSPMDDRVGETLLLELKAFPHAVEVAQAAGKPLSEDKGWWYRVLSWASTGIGSVKDFLDNLPPWAKNTLVIFKELIDIFRAK
jgi:hypothetical protein